MPEEIIPQPIRLTEEMVFSHTTVTDGTADSGFWTTQTASLRPRPRLISLYYCARSGCGVDINWARGTNAICSTCGQWHCKECMRAVEPDGHYCNECTSFFEECVWCGEDADIRIAVGRFRDIILCRNCQMDAFSCEECSEVVSIDVSNYCDDCDHSFCEGCYYDHEGECPSRGRPNVHDHYYTPQPLLFYGVGPQFMGVELEIDDGNDAQYLMTLADDLDEHVYLKEDGSLSDRGIEIVTHPATLDYHLNEFPWVDLIRAAHDGGYAATGACGLHIHVSRAGLGDTFARQDRTLSNLIILFYKHWDKMVKFSRRRGSNLNSWAKGNHVYKRSAGPELTEGDMIDCKGPRDRYVAINCIPDNTIEFRMFHSTLDYSVLMSTLEMVDHVVGISKSLTSKQIYKLAWEDIVSSAEPYKYLPEYLEARCA